MYFGVRTRLAGFFKKPTHFQKAESRQKSRPIIKKPAPAFWRQKSPNASTLKLYILRPRSPEEEPPSIVKTQSILVHDA